MNEIAITVSCHSKPNVYCHSEGSPLCHSEGSPLCHSEGAKRPKNLTQGKLWEESRFFATLRMTQTATEGSEVTLPEVRNMS